MNKNLTLVFICFGLGLATISFQNCGTHADFQGDHILSSEALQAIIQNDITTIANEDEKRIVLTHMDEVMNQDPRTVEEPLTDVMDENDSGAISLREEVLTYECTSGDGKSYSPKKYMLCHIPDGDYEKSVSLCLTEPGLKAHLKYYKNSSILSYMGPCK